MPAPDSQLTYEDVFRAFVQRALDEENKLCSSPWAVLDSASTDGGDASSRPADDGRDALSRASDGGGEGRGRGRGRRGSRSRGRGRGRGSSVADTDGGNVGPPPAKRPRGRPRGRGRASGVAAPVPADSVDSGDEPAAPSRDSREPETEGTEESDGGRRRSSRRSRARAVDFKHLLDDDDEEEEEEEKEENDEYVGENREEEDEDDPGGAEVPDRPGDESGDDWRPPERRPSGSSKEGSEEGASGAAVGQPRRRGRPLGSTSRGLGGTGCITRYKLPEDVAVKANTPPPASDRAPGTALKTGDFLINVDDINLKRPPIWRIDGKFLIQKYEPIKGKGQRLYKNMSTYMSWSASSDRFRPVSVRYHQMGRTEIIVELLDNPHSNTFNLSKMLSIEATSKYLENFEIYMQTLISQALDTNFLMEITQEGDEYFMKNVTIVQETNLERKKKILELKSWDDVTQTELDRLPVLELVLLRNVPPSECAVCHQTANARLVQIYGRPYDPTTLLTRDTGTPPGKRQYNMCSFCAGLADLYNKVQHLTYHLHLRCCEKVSLRKKEAGDDDSTRILNDILADEAWLSKAFSDVQQIWGDVDQIYTAAKEEEKQESSPSAQTDGGT